MEALLGSLPSCALTCMVEAATTSTCGLTDVNCICTNTALNAQLEACVFKTCSIKDALATKKFSYDTCNYPSVDDDKVYPAVNLVGMVVAIIAVALRVGGRFIGSRIGLDDCAIMATLCGAIAIAAVGIALGPSGLGKDIWMLTPDQITRVMHLFFVEENLYISCIAMTKISMLLLYLRLFPDETFRLVTKLLLVFTTCWGLAILLAQIFSCQPLNYFWHMWDGEHVGKCINHTALLWSHAIINIVLDVVIIGMPMPTLIKLKLSLGKKVGICLMFAVGIIVTIISILRFITGLSFSTTDNPTKKFVGVGVWSLLEVDIGILCACMPGIRAFFNYGWAVLTDKLSVYGSSRSHSNTTSRVPTHSKSSQQQSGNGGEFIRLQEIESTKDVTAR